MSVTDTSTLRCGFCGYRIGTSNDNAGNFEERANGSVVLHNGCAPQWDAEYQKYVAEGAHCIECGQPYAGEGRLCPQCFIAVKC